MKQHISKNNIQLVAGGIALVAMLIYTWVHTGGLLARYIVPGWVGYVAAFGIETAVVGLSLRIGDLKRSKQKTHFFVFVLGAVVVVSAIANIAEGFVSQTGASLTLVTVRQLDVMQAVIGVAATGLVSLIVLAMSEIIGTDIDALVKQVTRDDNRMAKLQQELSELRKQMTSAVKDRDKLVSQLATLQADRDTIMASLDKAMAERDKAMAELDKAMAELDVVSEGDVKQPFDLDTIPAILADYVTQLGNGVTPDGDFSDKWGVGASTIKRANSMFLNGVPK